jgi:class 3 adenylate cyclase
MSPMPQSRQIAAIMFTDIVGYTALMGNDEQKAFEYLKKNRALPYFFFNREDPQYLS